MDRSKRKIAVNSRRYSRLFALFAVLSFMANIALAGALIARGSPTPPDEFWPLVKEQLVRLYPVCYNGSDYEKVKGVLTTFARSKFLRYGLPTVVDEKGLLWVDRSAYWDSDDTNPRNADAISNWSTHAARDAYVRKHGRRPDNSKLINLCPFVRKSLLKNPSKDQPQ